MQSTKPRYKSNFISFAQESLDFILSRMCKKSDSKFVVIDTYRLKYKFYGNLEEYCKIFTT